MPYPDKRSSWIQTHYKLCSLLSPFQEDEHKRVVTSAILEGGSFPCVFFQHFIPCVLIQDLGVGGYMHATAVPTEARRGHQVLWS